MITLKDFVSYDDDSRLFDIEYDAEAEAFIVQTAENGSESPTTVTLTREEARTVAGYLTAMELELSRKGQ